MATPLQQDYNQRLFAGALRPYIHLSRFYWLKQQLYKLNLRAVKMIELGCYDAKTLQFLEHQPQQYLGLDANWEGGLDLGRARFKDHSNVELRLCLKPEDIPVPGEPYNVGVCMETLEHVPPTLVEPYLLKLSQVINGHLFITVPVERGISFLAKHTPKKLLGMSDYAFARGEFFNSVIGRLDRVERHEHKGFDDRVFVRQVQKYFDVVSVNGVFPKLPLRSLNLTLGIVAKTKS